MFVPVNVSVQQTVSVATDKHVEAALNAIEYQISNIDSQTAPQCMSSLFRRACLVGGVLLQRPLLTNPSRCIVVADSKVERHERRRRRAKLNPTRQKSRPLVPSHSLQRIVPGGADGASVCPHHPSITCNLDCTFETCDGRNVGKQAPDFHDAPPGIFWWSIDVTYTATTVVPLS